MDGTISFIHISDIHFTKESGDKHDLDKDLRNEILRDLTENAKSVIGEPAGILICGDIAFSGKSDEYSKALVFLKEMCEIFEIKETSILCVPGNHDVDQDMTKQSEIFYDQQNTIANSADIDTKLQSYLRDPTYGNLLFQHIHEYNSKFAGKFKCNLNQDKCIWEIPFQLNDGSVLHVIGLNSVLTSNHTDNEDSRMVIGQNQIPMNKDGATYLSLCHHPPECWKDPEDIIKNKLNKRVQIQLYGHKHLQKVKQIDNSLLIGSGAMHPSRADKSWRPKYNWITISVQNEESLRFLKVTIYPRILNDDNDKFIPDKNNCNVDGYDNYLLPLPNWKSTPMKKDKKISNKVIQPPNEILNETEPISNRIANPLRTLIYRFFDLSYIKRCKILSELNLISEDDEGAEHVDIIDKIIQKATQAKNLIDFWNRVNEEHNDGKYTDNPFNEKIKES